MWECVFSIVPPLLPRYRRAFCFMLESDLNVFLDCYANTNGISSSITELRHFLNVEYQPDGRNWIQGFLRYLGQRIPSQIPPMDKDTDKAAIITVCRHEGRDPNRIYRWSIIRHLKDDNGKQKHRSEYNSQLASKKFPILYSRFKADTTISFGFIDKEEKEKTEEEVLRNFESNERKRFLI